MLETLNNLDTQLFYFINHHHCTAMDYAMWFFSSKWCWFLAMVLAYVFTLRRGKRRLWWLPLVAMSLCFLLADQTSNLIKDTVCRLRPCWALEDVVMFHTRKGGKYGFVSSHAANAFALVTFYWLYWRKSSLEYASARALNVRGVHDELDESTLSSIALLLWAAITAYSRPYLGKHYPGDVVCGALLGILVGYLVYLLIRWLSRHLRSPKGVIPRRNLHAPRLYPARHDPEEAHRDEITR